MEHPETSRIRAQQVLEHIFAKGQANYERARQLPSLIPIDRCELSDMSAETTQSLILRLEQALRAERARGRAAHWSYSLTKHIGIIQALRAERASLVPKSAQAVRVARASLTRKRAPRRADNKKRCTDERDSVFKNFQS